MKISVIGASGKVGSELTRLLAEQHCFKQKVDIVLYSPNNARKIEGNLADLEESLIIRKQIPFQNVSLLPTADIENIKDSDLIIICSGIFATKEEKAKFSVSDNTGRNIQSLKNYNLMASICRDIKPRSPLSDVIVVTNQSDVMSARARDFLQNQNVYGLGCYLDTIRFRNILQQEAQKTGISLKNLKATILGFHNHNMFLDQNTFSVECPASHLNDLIKVAMEKTAKRGKEISDMQKDVHLPNINSGASKLPAAALYNIIEAFTQPRKKLKIPLNRLLTLEEASNLDESSSASAQLYCMITNKSIRPIKTKLTSRNLVDLKTGIKEISAEMMNLKNICKDI